MSWSSDASEAWSHVLHGQATTAEKTQVWAEIGAGAVLVGGLAFEIAERGAFQRLSRMIGNVGKLPNVSIVEHASMSGPADAALEIGLKAGQTAKVNSGAESVNTVSSARVAADAQSLNPPTVSLTSMIADEKLLDILGRDDIKVTRPSGGALITNDKDPDVRKFLDKHPLSMADLSQPERLDFVRVHTGMDAFRINRFDGLRTTPMTVDSDTAIGRSTYRGFRGADLVRDTVIRRDLGLAAEHVWHRSRGGAIQSNGLKIFDFESGSLISYEVQLPSGKTFGDPVRRSDVSFVRTQIFHSGRASIVRLTASEGTADINDFVAHHFDEAAQGLAMKPVFDSLQKAF